jgi:heme-degrading monooxygenase HmoA
MFMNHISLHVYPVELYMPDNIKYVKHNKIRFKSLENRYKGTRMFIEFFDSIIKDQTGKEMRGHVVLDSMSDQQESIVLTFWDTKEELDKFYSPQNKALANLVESAKPLFEKMPERTDYAVSGLSF